MTGAAIKLTKFDVAERQLMQAIRLFFSEGDAVSIHTLAEAASQVLYDIGKGEVTSVVRDSEIIRPERKKEWLGYVFSSRNFFKHADRDAAKEHEFKEEFNHFSIFDAVNMYSTLKKLWTPETFAYFIWFGRAYPQLLREEEHNNDFRSRLVALEQVGANERSLYAAMIEAWRKGQAPVPDGVSLELGLRA